MSPVRPADDPEPLLRWLAHLTEASALFERADASSADQRRAQMVALFGTIELIQSTATTSQWNGANLAAPLIALSNNLMDIENGIQPPGLTAPPSYKLARDPSAANRQKVFGASTMELYIRVDLTPKDAAKKTAAIMTAHGFHKRRKYGRFNDITAATITGWRKLLSRNKGLAGNTAGPLSAIYHDTVNRVSPRLRTEADVDAWTKRRIRRLPRL
jgi:hypothetical protein